MFQASSDISVQFGEFFWGWWSFGFERAGPVYKSHYEWNRSNSNTERTWFRKRWRLKWRRYFLHLWDSNFWRELYFSIAYFRDIQFSIDLFSVLDGQQPMHLFLSSNNAKSLEDAKFLAENLLDTISVECGASRYLILYCHIV